MATVTLSVVLVYLLSMEYAERKARKNTNRTVEMMKQDVGCYLFNL